MAISSGTWKAMPGDMCAVEGCDRPRKAVRSSDGRSRRYALCNAHRKRYDRLGDTQQDKPVGGFDPTVPVTYAGAHSRIRLRRGAASAHTCPCGKPASGWAYRGSAKHEFRGITGSSQSDMLWSGDPDDYDPMCSKCHRIADVAVRRARVRATEDALEAALIENARLKAEVEMLRTTHRDGKVTA